MPLPVFLPTHEYRPRHGGIARYVEETAAALARAGRDVTVAAPGVEAAPATPYPCATLPLPVHGTHGWPDRLRLLRWLRQHPALWRDSDVWLLEPGPLFLWLYHRELGLPRPRRLALVFHGSELLRLARLPHRLERLQRLVRCADRVGVVSEAVRALLLQVCPVEASRLVRVPGALPSGPALPIEAPQPAGPTAPGAPFHLLSIARIHPRKGLDLVLEALGRWPAVERRRVVFEVIGPVVRRGHARRLQARAAELGLDCLWRGSVSESARRAALRRTDACVLASRRHGRSVEGLGLAVLEAQAAGLPVVVTDSGGLPEAIQAGRTGLLVPADNPRALSEALWRLHRAPDLRARLGAQGPAWAATGFSWDANVARLSGH